MASLTGQLVAETYKALLKLIDNDILTASEKQITDGFGGGSNVFIDSQGFLRANKYKVTNGLATQFLKADGSLDSNAYLTSITGAQVITALGYTPVPTTRTITINGETHNLAADNTWTVGGTAAIWGNITGTLSNQTDLQNALNAKYNNPTGTISQYIRGDGTLATFPTMPGGLPTGGSAGQILSKIDATDYNTHWIDNYATQTKNEVKLGQTLTKGTPVYVSSANGTNIIVSRASNTSEALSSKTFGLLESGGATNDIVKCVTFGLIAGLDTSTAQAGDPVWLGVNGALIFGLANKPYAPAHLVYIGVVTRVQQNNGEIFVNIQNGFELKEIHDVYIADPANNHGLFYDIADGLWKNKSIASALGYTPQTQLSGTGFVKASGTTISYDNSTYLTTSDAASTYQLLTNLSTDLTASATKYPSVNAVNAGLATKQPLDADLTAIAGLTGTSGFLKKTAADTWTLDTSTYLTTGDASTTYLAITTAASTYQRLDKMVSNLLPSSTEYPNSNAVINALALKADAANPVFTGNMTISGATPRLYFVDTDQNPDYTVFIDSGYFYIYDQTAGATRFSINSSGNINTGVGKSITAGSFVKESGTSSQYLMADGSVTTLTNPVTGSGTTNYLPKWTSASGLGNSLIYDNGTNVGINFLNGTGIISPSLFNIKATVADGNQIYLVQDNDDRGWRIKAKNDGHLYIQSSYTTSVVDNIKIFYDTKNVSINNIVDSGYRLDVNGTGRFVGTVYVSQNSYTFPALTASYFGYSYSYNVLILGNSNSGQTRSLAFNVDVSDNPSGAFSGYGNEYIWRNSGSFITPNASNNGYNTLFGWNSSGSLTVDKSATFSSSVTTLGLCVNGYGALTNSASKFNLDFYNGNTRFYSLGSNTITKGGYEFHTNSSDGSLDVIALGISNSGIATFSSNVKVNGTNSALGTLSSKGSSTYNIAIEGMDSTGVYSIYLRPNTSSINMISSNYYGGSYLPLVLTAREATSDLVLFNDGNVSIGYSTNAGYKLDVNGTGRFGASTYKMLSISDAGGAGWATTGGASTAPQLYMYNTGTSAIVQTYINNVARLEVINTGISVTGAATFSGSVSASSIGIGNNTSGFGDIMLISSSSVNVYPRVNRTSNSYEAGWKLSTAGSADWYTGLRNTDGVNSFHFFSYTTGTSVVQITSGGNLIIGKTTDSGFKLQANGNNGSIAVTGGGYTVNPVPMLIGQYTSTIGYIQVPNQGNFEVWNGGTSTIAEFKNNSDVIFYGRSAIGGSLSTINTPSKLTIKANITDGNQIYIVQSNDDRGWKMKAQTDGHFYLQSAYTSSVTTVMKAFFDTSNVVFSATVTGTSFFESSDIRLKKLIESNPIINGIEKLEAKLYEKNGKIELGYFAQDAELIMPYAVTKNDEGFLNLSYREVHTAKIARLEQMVAELEKQLNLN